MSPPSASRCRGFTLIEMLVVLTVMGLLAALLVSQAGPASGSRFAGDRNEQKIRAALAEALLAARRTGQPVAVAPADFVEDAVAQPVLPMPRMGTIVFYPDGSSSGGHVAIGGRRVLEVDWLTGEARDAA